MKVDIDFEMLQATQMSADDFLYLYIIYRKGFNYLDNLNLRPKIVDNKPYKHKHIMKCLDNQLALERNKLGFLQNLETWINNYTWEKYENLNKDDTKDNTTRITRSL